VETVVKEQDGAVAAEGQKDADELVKGSTVYDYLNKGENGDGKLVLGTESRTITMGKGSEATGEESIAMGFDNQVNGNQNVTIGTKHMVKGDSNTVIGDPDNITGNKNVVLANDTNITGSRNVAIGNNITINGDDTFVMGNNVTANESNAVVLGNGSTAEKDAVSVGSKDGERQIKHVKAGTDPTDAATVGQVQEVAQGAYNNAVYLSNSINKLDNRVNKVGAGAAALAALHPIDTDDKFTMGLGYGNYRSAHAMAMGMFYRPTEKIMISVGGAFGNGENMVNAGISFALDKCKGFGTSKAVMAKNIKALSAENAAIKEENVGMKKQLDAQGQEIAALKAALARLEAKIGK
jgi:autotransporter adhesin